MEENNLEDVLNEEDTGLDGNGEDGEDTDVVPKEPIDESGEGNDGDGSPVEEPKEDESGQEDESEDESLEEVTIMNAYDSRNKAKSVLKNEQFKEIREQKIKVKEEIESSVANGDLSVITEPKLHQLIIEELKLLGYSVTHVSAEDKTLIRWE